MSGRALALVITAALLLRVGVAAAYWARVPVDDERAYDEVARSLLGGAGFSTVRPLGLVNRGGGTPTSVWGCLQPLYVASVYKFLGTEPGFVYLLNAAIGLVTVWSAARIGLALGGARSGLVAAWLVAIDPYLLKFSASLLSETPFIALLAASVVVLHRWARHGMLRDALLSGLLLGLAALARGLALYFAIAAVFWLLLEKGVSQRTLGQLLGFALILALVLSPWVLRNLAVHERPVFLDTKAGWNLYAYLHPDFDPWLGNQVPVPPEVVDPRVSESQRNEILLQQARAFVRRDPWHALARAPAKLALLWSPFPGRHTDPSLAPVKLLFVLPLELLALAGLACLRWHRQMARLIYVLIAYYLLVHSVMTGGPRFRAPLDPALAGLAGGAVATLLPGRESAETRAGKTAS